MTLSVGVGEGITVGENVGMTVSSSSSGVPPMGGRVVSGPGIGGRVACNSRLLLLDSMMVS